MSLNINTAIQKIGLSKCTSENLKYFTQFTSKENIKIPDDLPEINRIESIIIEPEIVSLKTINTIQGLSLEGQSFSGLKISVEVLLKQKIMYIGKEEYNNSLHVFEDLFYQNGYIIIPQKIEGTNPELLLENNFLQAKVYVEDISLVKIDGRTIAKTAFLFIELIDKPTYEICYAAYKKNKLSNLYLSFANGSNIVKLTDNNCINIKPLWSPDGQRIAYISNENGNYSLYLLDIRDGRKKNITNPKAFKKIYEFNWINNNELIFTAQINNNKKLFKVDIVDLVCKKLTCSNELMNFSKPKCSPDRSKVAFLRHIMGVSNLCLMDNAGLQNKQITFEGFVKDFSWSFDSKYIAYIKENEAKQDEIYVINQNNTDESFTIQMKGLNIVKVKQICFSTENQMLAFIGSDTITDNIYLFDLSESKLVNITKNYRNTFITSFAWKIDGSMIYYSANELGYCNIYSIKLKDKVKKQLTNTNYLKLELSYRPKIR